MPGADRQEPIVDDGNLQTLFYDDIVNAVVIGDIVRALAVEYRRNPVTGIYERVGVLRLARPVDRTDAIRAEFTRALCNAQGLRLAK